MNLLDFADNCTEVDNGTTYNSITEGFIEKSDKEIILLAIAFRKKMIFGLGVIIFLVSLVVGLAGVISNIATNKNADIVFNLVFTILLTAILTSALYYIFIGRLSSELLESKEITLQTTIKAINFQKSMSSLKIDHPKYRYTTFIFASPPKESYLLGEPISITFLPRSHTILSISRIK